MSRNMEMKNDCKDNKKSVVIYGNCHTTIITQMLQSCPAFDKEYYIIPTKPIQTIRDPKELYDDCYTNCDVFIHQSIRLNNRYGEEFASESIIARLKPGCRVISIPNVYHLPLCFFPQYSDAPELRWNGVTYFFRDSIIDSHLNNLVRLFSLVKADYANPARFKNEEIVAAFETFINKVRKREEDWDIKVSDFILENYRSHQLFYDPNHPTNFFLNYVSTELLKRLIDDQDLVPDNLPVDTCLDSIEIPVCKAAVNALRLDWMNDVIRLTRPVSNRLQSKMSLSKYVYHYLSCLWVASDCPGSIKIMSRLFWVLNSWALFVRKAYSRCMAIVHIQESAR